MNARRIFRTLTVIVTAAAIAAPVACAHHAPGENAARSAPTTTVTGIEVDRLGPKYVALHRPSTRPPVATVRVVGNGFHWRDAGLGAGVAAIGLGLVAAILVAQMRRARRSALTAEA
jgi:hypothetical protein